MTIGTVKIEVIKPAKTVVPVEIKSVLVINNSLARLSSEFGNDIQKALFKLDTATTQLISAMTVDIINESPRFDTCILLPDIYFRNPDDLFLQIEWDDAIKLCEQNNADILLSLEAFGIHNSIKKISYYDDYYGRVIGKKMEFAINSMWRIYIPATKRIMEKKVFRDTLYFDEFQSKDDYYNVITRDEAVLYVAKELASAVAVNVADRIAPYWLPVERDFFISSNSDMKQAAIYAYKDQWLNAAKLWKPLTESENGKLAGAACHNMALACEVEGKLDVAKQWLQKAVTKYDNYISQQYLRIIQKRIKESSVLDKQFGNQ
jgi:hypothetical protein